jgi:hypothetical protein
MMAPLTVLAFPEMVRHGYGNCTACHHSPNGGGVLTAYGRELSREVLSTWSKEEESRFLYFVKSPEWLALGGDVRFIQLYRNDAVVREARPIFMQGDIEGAATYQQFKAAVALGVNPTSVGGRIMSRRHWVQWQATPELGVRFGRFLRAYGIGTADHAIETKRGLGWDQGSEAYHLEGSWLKEKFDVFATVALGKLDGSASSESGLVLRGALNLEGRYKIGWSYFYGTKTGQTRHVTGPYAILGFTPKFFVLAELALQGANIAGSGNFFGWADYLRANYEIHRGVHVFLTQEYSLLRDSFSQREAYGLGFQFFPRPHWEIFASWQKTKIRAIADSFGDLAFVQFHFYL